MSNLITTQLSLFLSLTIEAKEQQNLDEFLRILNKSGVFDLLYESIRKPGGTGGRPPYNPYQLFTAILFAFSKRLGTLREIEDCCRNDIRFIYLMQQNYPSYVSIGNFINQYIIPNADQIFSLVTKAILDYVGIVPEDAYIDGTKIEADANRYKFVWKPTTWHKKLCVKIRALLKECSLDSDLPEDEILSVDCIRQKLEELRLVLGSAAEPETRKILEKQTRQLETYLVKATEYEEKEKICGPHRNSYYKTDHDATAMNLKSDYYSGLGSSMHAAYNCQIIVSGGFICAYEVSQSRNDLKRLISMVERFKKLTGTYPVNMVADAGYGSLENYQFLEEHGIGNYVKHSSWSGNISGRWPNQYVLNDDETITCLNGLTGYKTTLSGRHPRYSGSVFYRVEGCAGCPFHLYCKRYMTDKTENFKIFEVRENLCRYIQESEANLLSVKGIEKRVNRSCQVEGAFGIIKQDIGYTRFRRTSLVKAEAEFMLVCLGFNIRKLFRYMNGELKTEYWKASESIEPEKRKKPSAKRLANRELKKQEKSAKEKERDSYRYKKTK